MAHWTGVDHILARTDKEWDQADATVGETGRERPRELVAYGSRPSTASAFKANKGLYNLILTMSAPTIQTTVHICVWHNTGCTQQQGSHNTVCSFISNYSTIFRSMTILADHLTVLSFLLKQKTLIQLAKCSSI